MKNSNRKSQNDRKNEKGKIELTKLKGKMGSAKGKVTRVVNQLKISVPAFIGLTADGTDS